MSLNVGLPSCLVWEARRAYTLSVARTVCTAPLALFQPMCQIANGVSR